MLIVPKKMWHSFLFFAKLLMRRSEGKRSVIVISSWLAKFLSEFVFISLYSFLYYFYFTMLFKWYKLITVCSLSNLILNEWDPHHALNCETRLGAALANRVSIHHVCTMYSAYMKMDAMVLENQILSISNMIYNS